MLIAFFNLSVVICFFGNVYCQKKSEIDSLENVLKSSKQDSTKIIIQIKLYGLYYGFDSAKSEQYFNSAIHTAEKEGILVNANTLFEIGKAFENYKNDYTNALMYYEKASAKAKNEKDGEYIKYEGWLGYTLSKVGESEKAIEKLLRVVELAENEKQLSKLPRTYLLLAFAYRDFNNIEKADIYFNKSIEISNILGDSADIHTALHELGNLYNMKTDFTKAIEYHRKALEIRERLSLTNILVYSYHDISLDYISLNNLDTALIYSNKAEKLALKINEKWVLASIYSSIIEIHLKLKNYKEAEQYLEKLQKLADELNIKSVYFTLYRSYKDYYESRNQYENALKYYKLEIAYRDSISNEKTKRNISELDKKYETAKKDKEILQNQEHIRRQKIYITVSIAGFILMIIFTVIIYRQYRKIREANIKLENQNREIKRQKDEINNYAEELKEFNATKDKLFSIIAHDLRSPFTSIQGFSDLLIENIDAYDKQEIEKFIKLINKSSISTLDLLDKLLVWAKKQTGQMSFNPVDLNLNQIIQEILNVLSSTAKIKNINVKSEIPDMFYVYADSNMLKTVLRNLIQNAIKFTNTDGCVGITATNYSNKTEICISDNGIGMDTYTRENIFNIEKKKTSFGTDEEKGIGLGLVICKDFIEKHCGSIKVESELGKGSRFIFTLPVNKEKV